MMFLSFDQSAREATFGKSTAHALTVRRRIEHFHAAAISAVTVNDLWTPDEYESYAREGLISHYIYVLTGINCAEYNYEQFFGPNAVNPSKSEKAKFTEALNRFFGIEKANLKQQVQLCRWMHVLQQTLKKVAEIDSVKQAGIVFHQAKQRKEFYEVRACENYSPRGVADVNRQEMFKCALHEDRVAEHHQATLWYLIQSYVHRVKEIVAHNKYNLSNTERGLAKLSFKNPSPHWGQIKLLLPQIAFASCLDEKLSSVEPAEEEAKQPEAASAAQQTSCDESSAITVQEIKKTYKRYGGGFFATQSLFSRQQNIPDKIFTAMEKRRANKAEGASAKTLAHFGKE